MIRGWSISEFGHVTAKSNDAERILLHFYSKWNEWYFKYI